jgi:hypothetical protein
VYRFINAIVHKAIKPFEERSQSQSHIATDEQSISKSWCRAPSGAHDQILILFDSYGLALCGAFSDERKGLSFVYAAGLRQLSLSSVRVPWDSWPYFTVSDLRLPFSLPPTTCRVTVEVFDPASTRVWGTKFLSIIFKQSVRTSQETHYVSATKHNRLMLFRETFTVYCENHQENKYSLWAEYSF